MNLAKLKGEKILTPTHLCANPFPCVLPIYLHHPLSVALEGKKIRTRTKDISSRTVMAIVSAVLHILNSFSFVLLTQFRILCSSYFYLQNIVST